MKGSRVETWAQGSMTTPPPPPPKKKKKKKTEKNIEITTKAPDLSLRGSFFCGFFGGIGWYQGLK